MLQLFEGNIFDFPFVLKLVSAGGHHLFEGISLGW